ncbi:MAG: threonylcarbamoyl-AMP synthase [Methanomicrobia archaeon]|nr:threonylcarbamoyl-AMP synthase [Methanomicrobia archaeon]
MSTDKEVEDQIRAAIAAIKRGGTVVYPTETVYGLGADALSEDAVREVYELKGRDLSNPLSLAVSSFEMLQTVAYVDAELMAILKELLPGPVTVLLRGKKCVPDLVTAGSDLVGVRFPDNEIALRIIHETGPITATSANISGKTPPTRVEEVEIEADVIINGGRCKYSMPSTVVAMTSVTATGEETDKTSKLKIEIEIKRRGACYDRVLHILRSKIAGEGIHRLSVPELRRERDR